MGFDVHLVDGTFELFRCFHGAPRAQNVDGREVGAVRALLATLVSLLGRDDVTHAAVAFDSVVSPGGRPGPSPDQLIASQQSLAADVVRALAVPVWPSGRYQADEIIATAAARYADDPGVDRVVICSNDKDFHQCVRGDRVVAWDRIRDVVTDERAVRDRYGVTPQQIPDLFALVGDRSDGLPGVPGWGEKSAAAALGAFGTAGSIPLDAAAWPAGIRGAERLATSLAEHHDETMLCRDLSELRTDLPLRQNAADLEWRGAKRSAIEAVCARIEDDSVIGRLDHWIG